MSFKLSLSDFKNIIFQKCHYCNNLPEKYAVNNDNRAKHLNGNPLVNGIDRVNNDKGYITKNCVPCCMKCNYAKRNLNQKDFFQLIKDIYEHNSLNNIHSLS